MKQDTSGLRITVSEWKPDSRFEREMERLEGQKQKYKRRRLLQRCA